MSDMLQLVVWQLKWSYFQDDKLKHIGHLTRFSSFV